MSDELRPSPLERRYRRWLRAYPAAYRAEREEELVGVLLDGAARDQQRPTAGEVADLVRAGLVARLRAPAGMPAPRAAAANLVAIVATLILGVEGLVVGIVVLRTSPVPIAEVATTPGWFAPWIWTLAALALMAGRARPAMVAAWVAAGSQVVAIVAQLLEAFSRFGAVPGLLAFQSSAVLLALVAAALLSRPSSVGRSLAVLGWRRVALAAVGLAGLTWFTHLRWLPVGAGSRDPAMFALEVVVATMCLVPGSVGARRRDPVVRRAAVLFGALLVFGMVSGGYRSPGITLSVPSPLGAVAVVALDLVITAVIVVVGVRAVRFARGLPGRRLRRSA